MQTQSPSIVKPAPIIVKPVDAENKPVIVNIHQLNEGIEQHLQIIHEKFKALLAEKTYSSALWGAVGYKTESIAEQYDSIFNEQIYKKRAKVTTEEIDQSCKAVLAYNTNSYLVPIISGIFDIYKHLIALRNELNKFDVIEEKKASLSKQITNFYELTQFVKEEQSVRPDFKRTVTFDQRLQQLEAFNRAARADQLTDGCEEVEAKEIEKPKILLVRRLDEIAAQQLEFETSTTSFNIDEEKLKEIYKKNIQHLLELEQKKLLDDRTRHILELKQVESYVVTEKKRQEAQRHQLQQLEQALATAKITDIEAKLAQIELDIKNETQSPEATDVSHQFNVLKAWVQGWQLNALINPLHEDKQISTILAFENEIRNNLISLAKIFSDIENAVNHFSHLKESYGQLVINFFDFSTQYRAAFRNTINPVLKAITDLNTVSDTTERLNLKKALTDLFIYVNSFIFNPLCDESQQKSILTKYLMFLELHKAQQNIPTLVAEYKLTLTKSKDVFELEMKQTQTTANTFKTRCEAIAKRAKEKAIAETTEFATAKAAALRELESDCRYMTQLQHSFTPLKVAHQILVRSASALSKAIAARKEQLASASVVEVKVDMPETRTEHQALVPVNAAQTEAAIPTSRKYLIWGILAVITLIATLTGGALLLDSEFGAALGLIFGGIVAASCCGYQSSRALGDSRKAEPLLTLDLDLEAGPEHDKAQRSTHYHLLQSSPKAGAKAAIALSALPSHSRPVEFKEPAQWSPRAVAGRTSVAAIKKPVKSTKKLTRPL